MVSLCSAFSRQNLATSRETLFIHGNYDESMYIRDVHIPNLLALVEFA